MNRLTVQNLSFRYPGGQPLLEDISFNAGGDIPLTTVTVDEKYVEEHLSGMIAETGSFGRRRSYILTDRGRQALREEYERMQKQLRDYERCMTEQGREPKC